VGEAVVFFSNFDEARRWFKDQPREVCIAMAVRAALRVMPTVRSYILEDASARSASLVLPLLRTMAAPLVTATWPPGNGKLESAAAAAARAASAAFTGTVPIPGDAALTAVHTATAAIDAALTAANSSPTNTAIMAARASVAARAATAPTDAADANADAAMADSLTSVELSRRPLWPEGMPEKIRNDWSTLRSTLLDLDPGWSVWTDWYEDRLLGADDPLSRPLIESLEVERALIPDAEWEKGPAHVNSLIAEIEAKYRACVPAQEPASAQFEWGDDGKLHVLPPVLPKERNAVQEARRRVAWSAQEEHLSAFEQVLKAGNFQALDPVLVSYRKALGGRYEDLNVIALGIHGARITSLASRADDILMGMAASELESFADSHGKFIRQFDEWHDYEADSERAPTQEEVTALVQTARAIAAETAIVTPESSEILEEAVQSVEMVTVGDGENDKVPPPMEALKNARRLVGNALSKFFAPILERVKKGSLDGLEEGCKIFVKSAIYQGLRIGLPVLAAHHFGWISYAVKVIEPALKAAGLL